MYTFEYRFYPKSFETPSIDDFDDSMQWFLSALYKNGQILEHFQNSVKRETSYACRVTAPVICGDCHQAVPLYKLPKTYYGEEYYDLYNWQKVYESCDRQFMEGIGERHGYRMMHDPNSMLAQEGIRICRFLEKETGKPFYYYLFQYYRKNKPVCPICGNSWVNDDHTRIKYPFVCVNCRVLSEDIIKK